MECLTSRRASLLASATLIAFLTIASPASVSAAEVHCGDNVFGTLQFAAKPGERNLVELRQTGRTLTVIDAGAVIDSAPPCVRVSAHEVRFSPSQAPYNAWLQLGDLADELQVRVLSRSTPGPMNPGSSELRTRAVLGTGDDVAHGSEGDESFVAGGDGVFGGGDEADGADTVRGGGGLDSMAYDGRTAGVSINPDGLPNDGGPGERDDIDGVSNLSGGDGDDTLITEEPISYLYGNGGDDRLIGGPGGDYLDGDAGNDAYRGGPGHDRVDYGGAESGVSVTLDGAANDGEPGQVESVGGDIEDISGSDYDDVLVGNEGMNRLVGRGGDDLIDARDGPDRLQGGAGADRLLAGSGNDHVDALESDAGGPWSTWRDLVSCGAGNDYVDKDPNDTLEGCEAGRAPPGGGFGEVGCPPPPYIPWIGPCPSAEVRRGVAAVRSGVAAVRFRCPRKGPRRCQGRLSLRAGRSGRASKASSARLHLGSRSFAVRRGRAATLRVKLNRRGRRALGRQRRLDAYAVARYRLRGGRLRVLTRPTVLVLEPAQRR